MRVREGRNPDEGRVEIRVNGQWGVICSDHWSLLEARVVCGQLGRGYARTAMRVCNTEEPYRACQYHIWTHLLKETRNRSCHVEGIESYTYNAIKMNEFSTFVKLALCVTDIP